MSNEEHAASTIQAAARGRAVRVELPVAADASGPFGVFEESFDPAPASPFNEATAHVAFIEELVTTLPLRLVCVPLPSWLSHCPCAVWWAGSLARPADRRLHPALLPPPASRGRPARRGRGGRPVRCRRSWPSCCCWCSSLAGDLRAVVLLRHPNVITSLLWS